MDARSRINVLLVTVQLETIGGSERLIYQLASGLDRHLFNPSVVWLDGTGVLKEFTELGVPLHHIPKRRRVDVSAMMALSRYISSNHIDLVNAHHFMPMLYSFFGAKIGNKSRLIYTEHSQWEVQQIPRKWQWVGSCMLKRSDGAIGVNPAVSRELQSKFGMPADKVPSVLNGVDVRAYGDGKNRAAIRAGLGVGVDEKVIVIVANFRRVKNHLFLIQAFHELLKEEKNIKLLMVGEGYANDPENSEHEVRGYLHEHGMDENVVSLGYRTDIPDILAIADVFCLPSLKEGMPISLIEAMAAGVAVVGARVEGIRDVIEHGQSGFLVDLGDVTGLKSILRLLVHDDRLRERVGLASRSRVEKNYSLENCIKSYEKIFMRVLGRDQH